MTSFRTGDYLVYLLRPGQSFQAWWAYHQYLQGLRRAYARYGVPELANTTQPLMVALVYRLQPPPGGRSQTLVAGLAVDIHPANEPIEFGELRISPGSDVGWFHGGWSEDRDCISVLGRCWQHLLDELGLDEGYGPAGEHAVRAWGRGGAQQIAGPIPGPLHYRSVMLRVQSQIMPADQWDDYVNECRQLGGLIMEEAA